MSEVEVSRNKYASYILVRSCICTFGIPSVFRVLFSSFSRTDCTVFSLVIVSNALCFKSSLLRPLFLAGVQVEQTLVGHLPACFIDNISIGI